MADKPCASCAHYDPIKRGTADTRRGWCAAKSIYPAQPQKGQAFPPEASRAMPGERASPFIVIGSEVARGCDQHRSKP